MFFAEEAPSIPAIDALLPPWAQQLSVLALLVLIISAWLRGWVVTRAENERNIAAERRVSDIWEKNFHESAGTNEKLIAALDPILKGNEAILKAVTEVQAEQARYRQRGNR